MAKRKVVLVLGGGGSRGFAHIGLLKMLEKSQTEVEAILGVSIGAIIGGLYAYYQKADRVEEILKSFLFSEKFKKKHIKGLREDTEKVTDSFWDQVVNVVKERIVINLAASKKSLTDGKDLEEGIHELFQEIHSFEDLQIPFKCLATDLITGEPILFDTGDIKFAVRASANIPGYFPPIHFGKMVLVDGAVANNLPANIARELYPESIIVLSDVSESIHKTVDLDSVYDIIIRSANITQYHYHKHLLKFADYVVPHPVGQYVWYDFEKFDELVQKGYETSLRVLQPMLRSSLKRELWMDKVKSTFKKLFY